MQDVVDLKVTAKLFRGLGDESRLAILEALRNGPRNVSEIIRATGLTQSNTSIHLDCLFCCGLVERERRGRYIYYRIRSRKTVQLINLTHQVLESVADHIRECGRYKK